MSNITDLLNRPGIHRVTVDENDAAILLGLNDRNRRVTNRRIEMYATAMTDGRWSLSADAITVDNGRLVNGQHRLLALRIAGTPQEFLLAVDQGIAFDVLDNGKARTAADILGLRYGEAATHAGALSSAVRLILSHDSGGPRTAGLADNRFIEQFVEQHQEILKIVQQLEVDRRDRQCDMPGGVAIALEALAWVVAHGYRLVPEVNAQMFAENVLFGAVNDLDEPVAVLRRQIVKNLHRPVTMRYGVLDYVSLVTRAYVADARNERRGRTNYRPVRGQTWMTMLGQRHPVLGWKPGEEPFV